MFQICFRRTQTTPEEEHRMLVTNLVIFNSIMYQLAFSHKEDKGRERPLVIEPQEPGRKFNTQFWISKTIYVVNFGYLFGDLMRSIWQSIPIVLKDNFLPIS